MSLNKQDAESAYQKLVKEWGREPTWEEFKRASMEGRVRVDKTVAAQNIFLEGVPKAYRLVYGVITLWAGYLMVPLFLGLWFFGHVGAWWIPGSILIAWYLIRVSRAGQCQGIRVGAEENEKLYETLMKSGAFLFSPAGKG